MSDRPKDSFPAVSDTIHLPEANKMLNGNNHKVPKTSELQKNTAKWSETESRQQGKEAEKILGRGNSWDTVPGISRDPTEKGEVYSGDILNILDIPPERRDFVSKIRGYIGINEGQNPDVVKKFLMAGGAGKNITEETAWCMGFAQTVLREFGYTGKQTLWARDGLNIGLPTKNPKPGDLVIVERGDGGHIGFYVGKSEGGNPIIIGGNQGENGEVSIKEETRKVLGYRSLDGLLGNQAGELAMN